MKRLFAILIVLLVTSLCGAQQELTSGSTDEYVYFVAVDGTDLHTRVPGLVSGDFTVKYSPNGTSFITMTTPTVTEITGGDGEYSILADEAGMTTLAAGKDQANMIIRVTHASIDPVTLSCVVKRPKITAGSTSVAQTGDAYAIINDGTHGNAALEALVDDIGVAGAGLTAIPWNASWDAEVESEVTDAIMTYDVPTEAQMNARTVASASYLTLATVIDGSETLEDILECQLAFMAGKATVTSGLTTRTITYYKRDGTTVKMSIISRKSDGNRSATGVVN